MLFRRRLRDWHRISSSSTRSLLAEPQSCVASLGGPADMPTVEHAREYLSRFGGFQHVYQSMLSAANHKFPSIRFNEKFPGSARYIVDSYEVQGAFTKAGFAFMQDAIKHPDPYFSGEEWVLGPQSSTDRRPRHACLLNCKTTTPWTSFRHGARL